MPNKGWTHRNWALDYVREIYRDYKQGAVVYFADDDNAYDIRIFDEYIRKVKRIGVWAVALAGGAAVETPRVENGTVVGWNVVWGPHRPFATDMAGFAVNLNEILRVPTANFATCVGKSPETCFLEQFGLSKEDLEPFGHDSDPKEVLAWHVKTSYLGMEGSNRGYDNVEL